MKKKILYIITQSEFGGAQRYLLELISYLDPEKYEISVAAGLVHRSFSEGGTGGDLLDRLRAQNCQIYPLKHLVREISPIHDILAYFELKKLISEVKPDIVQLLSTKAGILGSLAAKRWKKNSQSIREKINSQNIRDDNKNDSQKISETDSRFISEIIYRIGGWVFLEELPKWKKMLYKKLEKWTAKFKDVIVVNCEAHRQLAIKLKIAQPEKIVTIYNGIDLDKLNFLPYDEARKKLSTINNEQLTIGCIANFYKNKGLEYLIKAVSQLSIINYQLLIIGDGIERENLVKLIKELDVEDRVILTGQLPNAYQYLKAFDVFVLPSIKEGQPWSILEAMAAEVPIIATNIAAIPEMLKDGESGLLVEPKNPKAIAEKIEYLIKNSEIAKNLASSAQKEVDKKFTVEKMVQETERLY